MTNGSKLPSTKVPNTSQISVVESKVDPSKDGANTTPDLLVGGATTYLNTLLRQMIAKQKSNKSPRVIPNE